MKSLISKKILSRLFSISILFFAIYPLIPIKLEGLSVILFAIISFLFFLQHYRTRRILIVEFLVTTTVFFLFLLSAVLSEDVKLAFKKIETMLSLIVIPLTFYMFLGKGAIDFIKYKNYFFNIFFTANVAYCLVLISFFITYVNPKYPTYDTNFFRNAVQDIPIIGEHPIYSSIFLSIAVLIGLTLYKRKKNKLKHNLFIAIGHIIIVSMLFILMSRGVMIALFCSAFIIMLTKIRTKRVYLVILSGLVILFLLIPSSNNRFNQLFNKVSYNTLDINNSTSIRFQILKCTMNLLIENPIVGYGLGDVQNELDNCYEHNEMNFPKDHLNSHNQYLFVWLSLGIFGLFIFFIFIGFYFKIAIANKDYLMLSIILFYSIVFLFENVLSRQSGVILFSFILNFMAIEKLNQN